MSHYLISILMFSCLGELFRDTSTHDSYIFVNESKTFQDARTHCQNEYNSDLAILLGTSQEEEIIRILTDENISNAWVGGSDMSKKGEWYWLDGTVIDTLRFSSETDINKNCLAISRANNSFLDENCFETKAFFCQKEETMYTIDARFNQGSSIQILTSNEHARKLVTTSFVLVTSSKSFSDARVYCQETYGSDLAIIDTGTDQIDVVNLIGSRERAFWVGGTDVVTEGTWQWLDGTNFALTYRNWGTSQPVGGLSINCLTVRGQSWNNFTWGDANCDNTNFFICDTESYTVDSIYTPTSTPTANPSTTPTQNTLNPTMETSVPTKSPTKSPVNLCDGQNKAFPGAVAASMGFHVPQNKALTSAIFKTDIDTPVFSTKNACYYYLTSSIENWSDNSGSSSCSVSTVEFSSVADNYEEFKESDSKTLGLAYTGDPSGLSQASGSISVTRVDFQLEASTAQFQYYTLDVQCTDSSYNFKDASELVFTNSFANGVARLPQDFTSGDDLEDFKEFWNSYGTHFMQTGKLGGKIYGSVMAKLCSLESQSISSTEFTADLNVAYQGVEVSTEIEQEKYAASVQKVEDAVSKQDFVISGGTSDTFIDVFTTLDTGSSTERNAAIEEWIASLPEDPIVVSGNFIEIGNLLEDVADTSSNFFVDNSILTNEELMNVATSMQIAYVDYSNELIADDKVTCSFECNNKGVQNNLTCECTCKAKNTVSAACCVFEGVKKNNSPCFFSCNYQIIFFICLCFFCCFF